MKAEVSVREEIEVGVVTVSGTDKNVCVTAEVLVPPWEDGYGVQSDVDGERMAARSEDAVAILKVMRRGGKALTTERTDTHAHHDL